MFSYAFTNLLMTTDLPTTKSSFASTTASNKKSIKNKNKSKKGDQISECFFFFLQVLII